MMHPWTKPNLPRTPHSPSRAQIDIEADGRVRARFLSNLAQQAQLLAPGAGWEIGDLIHWLDRNILHRDIAAEQSHLFLMRVVRQLMEDRAMSLERLVQARYRLRDAVANKIESHRRTARQNAFAAFITDDQRLIVSPEKVFTYREYPYPTNSIQRGQHPFRKHLYPTVGDLTPGTEEYQCAQVIDALDDVSVWVRNLDRQPAHAFWLQTSRWRFYPDFVCRLVDGRILVVEYKGSHLYRDAEEKRLVGELWERRSNGSCLFVMPTNREYQAVRAKIVGA
jgi:type III restriction enzyme